MGRLFSRCVLLALVLGLYAAARAQQVADADFKPPITHPAYATGQGPVVLIDEAHANFHTATGRYLPFAEFLRRDGYVVKGSAAKFSGDVLRGAKILVIANALHESNANNWSLPTPSAFTAEEIAAARAWVEQGGALFLIVDHMPFPGAAEKLAAAFGIKFVNGFALKEKALSAPDYFRRDDGTLMADAVTNGRDTSEKIDTVRTFTGSAFQVGPNARPVLKLGTAFTALSPQTAWQFDEKTPRAPLDGWLQGAVLEQGRGRVAVFGEAAMFSAQLAGPQKAPMGMNAPDAKQNPQLLLNIMHWLSGILQNGR